MNRRLQQFLELENLTSAKLAETLSVQASGISHILSGRNKPGFDFIQKIATKYPQINLEWLITGKGKPYKELNQDSPNLFNPSTVNEDSSVIDFEFNNEVNTDKPLEETKISISKKIRRITIFYNDDSFEEFYSSKQ